MASCPTSTEKIKNQCFRATSNFHYSLQKPYRFGVRKG
jgi:hypothetical protein